MLYDLDLTTNVLTLLDVLLQLLLLLLFGFLELLPPLLHVAHRLRNDVSIVV